MLVKKTILVFFMYRIQYYCIYHCIEYSITDLWNFLKGSGFFYFKQKNAEKVSVH